MNLTQPIPKFLFNTLVTADFGVYTDSVLSAKMLLIKKEGIAIPYVSGKSSSTKISPDEGAGKSVYLVLSTVCPCEECHYEYGIKVVKSVKRPGVLNDKYYPESRFYGSELANVQECTAGVMAAADVLAMEDEILAQIGADADASVDGFRVYEMSDDDASDTSTLTITIAGVTTTITKTGAHVATITGEAQMVAAINGEAAVNTVVFAARGITADKFWIISLASGGLFTAAAGTDTTLIQRGMLLDSKVVDEPFRVETEDGFATQTGWYHFKLSASDAYAANANVTMYNKVAGTWNTRAITSDTNIATVVAAINSGAAEVNASLMDTDKIWVLGDATVQGMDVAIPAGSNLTLFEFMTATGEWSYMTSDDVFRVFMHNPSHGVLSEMSYSQNKPVDGTSYTKYIIKNTSDVAQLSGGAGHMGTFFKEVHLYIATSYLATDIWDATDYMYEADNAAFTADQTFDEVLTYWAA
jgi:hypothetical protein